MTEEVRMEIANPLVIMFENEGGDLSCHIHPKAGYTHEHYGLLICDLVRHVAAAYKVEEEMVWRWVDKERNDPTTKVRQLS